MHWGILVEEIGNCFQCPFQNQRAKNSHSIRREEGKRLKSKSFMYTTIVCKSFYHINDVLLWHDISMKEIICIWRRMTYCSVDGNCINITCSLRCKVSAMQSNIKIHMWDCRRNINFCSISIYLKFHKTDFFSTLTCLCLWYMWIFFQ